MKLYEALKEIVKLKGKNIITDSALLNYLNDYHAFEERPASKLVLRDIINGGYSDKILLLNNKESSWTIKLKSYEHDFADSCGYKEELVLFVFQSVAYAINLTDKKPGEGIDEVLDFHPFFDDEEQQSTIPAPKPSPSQKPDSVDDKDYLKIAQDFVDNGKLDTARSIAEKIVNGSAKNDDNTIKATILIGHIMRKKCKYKEALDYYNQALNAEANLLKINAKDLQHRITNREIKDFEDIDIHYMFCLLGIGHITKDRWIEFVRNKAVKGNVTALIYCAQYGIDPQRHVDVFFTDFSNIEKGDYLYEDGSFSHDESELKPIVGKVFSLEVSEVEKRNGWIHGRVVATTHWKDYGRRHFPKVKWGENRNLPFPHTHYSSDDLRHLDSINSRLFSELLITDLYEIPGNAFYEARHFKFNIPLANASNWYLPNYIQARLLNWNDFGIGDDEYIWTSSQGDQENAIMCDLKYSSKFLFLEHKSKKHWVVPIFSF